MRDFKSVYDSVFLKNAIMENCGDIVTIKDINLKYIFCNKAFFDVLGIKNNLNIINKGVWDVLDENNSKIISSISNSVINLKTPQSFYLKIENGIQPKIIKTMVYPIIKNGAVFRLLSVSRDVTDEESIKLKLVEKICTINSLLDNIPMIAYIKDKYNNYVIGSKHSKKFFNEGLDSYAGNIKINLLEESISASSEDNYIISDKKSIIKEKSFLSVDGNKHWYKVHKSPVANTNNEVNGVITIAQNIDAEKQLESQKELFLATLTHDLKNPLQAQISSLQLLSKGKFGSVNESQREVLNMIIESASFMREMLQSILSTYKYENGLVKLHKVSFDINKLIDICMQEARYLAEDKNVQLEYRNISKVDYINADESQIRRVITNMLNNAINYAYKNTKISLSFQERGNNYAIKIKNISEPIPEHIKSRIFDKYVAGLDSSKRKGIGLGLYFCKKVINAHNGNIILNTENGENEFVIELPKNVSSDVTVNLV